MKINDLHSILPHRYQIIYADPPWQYNDKSKNRGGAAKYYQTLNISQLADLPVACVGLPDSALFMWATWPTLNDALWLMGQWGYRYKTCAFVWVKQNKKTPSLFWGMGHWTRSNTEFCLLGIRGKPKRVDCGVHQVIQAPIMDHSRKPDSARRLIRKLMGNGPAIELFARGISPGFDSWGNEL